MWREDFCKDCYEWDNEQSTPPYGWCNEKDEITEERDLACSLFSPLK